MASVLSPKPPKVDTSAQDAQIKAQQAEADRLSAAENAKRRGQIGRTSGSRSLLTGLETGVLKQNLG